MHETEALAAAERTDSQRRGGAKLPTLAGIPVSIKDNFDEAGHVTLAGSMVLAGSAKAARDAIVVERLRNAGAILIGRTNMTEFAYSGLGINPHYGTPRNAFDRVTGRLPGGSSSGAAISVTDGMAMGAIGTDTGGSIRIPAALNGLVGFKPTARRVPLAGVLPLSCSLDSAGPLAQTVAECALLDQVLAGESHGAPEEEIQLRSLRLAVPKTTFHDDLSAEVAAAFSAALSRLAAAGARITELPMAQLAQAAEVNPRGVLVSAEAYSWHRHLIASSGTRYDPRCPRIRAGEGALAADYIELLQRRARFIREIEAAAAGYDAMLMPTVADTAPSIAEVTKDDESYFRFNGRMLRNPALVNLFDGCALSIPCHEPGRAPVGLMVAGTQGTDRRILAIGMAVEQIVRAQPR